MSKMNYFWLLFLGIILFLYLGESIGQSAFIILGIIVAIIVGVAVMKRRKPSITPVSQNDDTMFFGCPRCGGNTQIVSGKQYCAVCKISL